QGEDRLAGEEPRQIIGHLARGLVPLRGILLQRLHADVLKLTGYGGVDSTRQFRVALTNQANLIPNAVAAKRRRSRDQLIEDGPERKDVASRVQRRMTLRLFGRKVVGGSHDLAG